MKKIAYIKRIRPQLVFLGIALIIISIFCVFAESKFDLTTQRKTANAPIVPESEWVFTQELKDVQTDTLSAINIQFGANDRQNKGNIHVEIHENDELLEDWDRLSSMASANSYLTFKFDKPVAVNSENKYQLIIQQTYEGDNGLLLWTNKEDTAGYVLDGEAFENGSICYTLTYRNEHKKALVIIIGVAVFVMIAALILLRANEVALMATILFALLVSYMIICPLGMAPDEGNHFFRAYEVANVSLISRHMGENGRGGNDLPRAICQYADREAELDRNDVEAVSFVNTALYAPLTYLPEATGIKIAGLFTNNVSKIFYGGKIANALFCFVLCVSALALVPFGRKILFVIMCFPMTIQEMVTLTPDGFTISLCLFFLAYILKLSYGKKPVRAKDVIILSVIGIIISLCKIVYVVLLALIFLIPQKRYKSKRQWLLFNGMLIFAAVVLNLIWLKISSGFLIEFKPGVDSPAQVAYVLTHIFDYYVVCVRSLLNNLLFWTSTMIGSSMGALNITISSAVWLTMTVLLVYETCVCQENDLNVKPYHSLILLLTFLAGVALIFTSLYVQWTPLKNETINGIQGRYYTPLIGLLAYSVALMRQKALNDGGIRVKAQYPISYAALLVLLCNGMTLLDVIYYYINRI